MKQAFTGGGANESACWVAADLMETLRVGGLDGVPCSAVEAALDGIVTPQSPHLLDMVSALWSVVGGGMADGAAWAHEALGLAFWPLLFLLLVPAFRFPVRALEHLVEHRGAFAAIVAGVVLFEESDGGVRGVSQDVAIMVAATSFLVLALLPMAVESLASVQRHVEGVVLRRVVRRLTPAHGGAPKRGHVEWGRAAGERRTIVSRPPRGSLRERFDIAAARLSSFLCRNGINIGPASRPILSHDRYNSNPERYQTGHKYWPAPTQGDPYWAKWAPERDWTPAAQPEAAEPIPMGAPIDVPPYRLQDDGFLAVLMIDLNEADGYYQSRIAVIDAQISASQAVADVVAPERPHGLTDLMALRLRKSRLVNLQKDVRALLADGQYEITAKRERDVAEAISSAAARLRTLADHFAETEYPTPQRSVSVTEKPHAIDGWTADKSLTPLLLMRTDNAQALFWTRPIDGASRRLSATEAFEQLPHLMDSGIAKTLRAMAGPRHKQFVKTAYWKIVADFVKQRDGHRCYRCGANESLQVHHQHYDTKGDEWRDLECLSTVCNDCHEDIHDLQRRNKSSHFHIGSDDIAGTPKPF